jgi:hypothetical protein
MNVLLGDGTGNFTQVTGGPINTDGYPLLVQDFNGDGYQDILLGYNEQLSVLLGNGDGTFRTAPGSPFAQYQYTNSVPAAAADFNGDGIPDFAIVDNFYLIVYFGKGDGSFQTPIIGSGVGSTFVSMVAGDFNDDGIPDLAGQDYYGSVYLFLGNGDGTFGSATTVLSANVVGATPSTIAAADFNGDGNLDLAVTLQLGNRVGILLGNGDGTFTQATGSPIQMTGPSMFTRAAVGDFNGDGTPDLLVQGISSGITLAPASVLLGNGDGTFTASTATIPGGPCCYNSVLSDFNGDRLTDVVTSSYIYDTAQVLFAQDATATATASGISAVGSATDKVVAQYPGDGNFSLSTSAPVELINAPVFDPPGGSYSSAQSVSITSATPNTTIYYTTNGETPMVGFHTYTSPISLISSETVKAIAYSQDGLPSAMTTASYVIPAPVPSIGSLYPPSMTAGSASFMLTVNGTNFTDQSKVLWGTTTLSTEYVSATELQAEVTYSQVATEGIASITVETPAPGGGTSAPVTFEVDAIPPYLGGTSPTSVAVGSAAFTLTAEGTYFTNQSTIMWGTTPLATQFVTPAKLTAQVPASLVASAGNASVTVETPAPGGGTSGASSFSIYTSAPVPSVSSISPASIAAGSAAFPLVVYGANFISSSTIMWGATPLTTQYASATELMAVVPASLVASAGTASITVQTPTPGGGTSGASNFSIYTPAPVPSISSISPTSAVAGSAAFTLTVNGANFASASTVQWAGTPLATQYVSATELTAQVPASLVASVGTASVTVQTPAPGGGTSGALSFSTYAPAPVPSVSSIAPTSVAVGSAAFTLTVNGSNFTNASTVQWGTTPLTTQYVSATELTAQVPASLLVSAGMVSVTVQTPAPGGGTSGASTFSIYIPVMIPSISSTSPASTAAGSAAFTLTVNGANFTSSSAVLWGTTSLTTQYVSGTQLTAQVPASLVASAGTPSVTVQTPGTSGGTSGAYSFEIDTAGSSTPPSFSQASATVAAGSPATYPVTLPSSAANVSLSCLNLPAHVTCSYSASTGTVTVATAASTPPGTYLITAVFTETLPGAASSIILLPLLLVPFAGKRKRNKAGVVLLALVGLAIAVTAAGGCGGSGSAPVTTSVTTHGATSSGTVTLVVH